MSYYERLLKEKGIKLGIMQREARKALRLSSRLYRQHRKPRTVGSKAQ